nr:MAG TPA: hypothetical protein [Bacteriophage sp.]
MILIKDFISRLLYTYNTFFLFSTCGVCGH